MATEAGARGLGYEGLREDGPEMSRVMPRVQLAEARMTDPNSTPAYFSVKVCSSCGVMKSVNSFRRRWLGNRWHAVCRLCEQSKPSLVRRIARAIRTKRDVRYLRKVREALRKL